MPKRNYEKEEKYRIIGQDEIREAAQVMKRYKDGKASLDQRVKENEQWWKLRHWDYIRQGEKKKTEPASAWLFNSIANKHADAMDNYPEPNVLARAEDDKTAAKSLSAILPTVLEQNNYEETYSDTWWYKLKQGTGIKGIFWNPQKENGLGDVDVKMCDILNLFWEPGIKNIQDSRNLFHVSMIDTDTLKETYPDITFEPSTVLKTEEYIYDDTVDTTEKTVVVDWYYKKSLNGKTILHYVKFTDDTLIFASENEDEYRERGFYDHGLYPFVFDKLFTIEGSPCGFGYIDVMRDPQKFTDLLKQSILDNAIRASRKRFFFTPNAGLNADDFNNLDKDLVEVNNLRDDTLREIITEPLPQVYMNILEYEIEELKETSGNRDFSQGSTSNGVTAASAIAALIEAGSKLSRDMISSSYRAFTNECYMVIELIRQFYNLPRCFRITGETGKTEYVSFDNTGMMPVEQGNDFGEELGTRKPVFDIKVMAAKKSTYSRMSQNELAIQLFGLGVFNPDMATQAVMLLEMMDFEGKDKLLEKVRENGTIIDTMKRMQAQMMQMAQAIDMLQAERGNPTDLTSQVAAQYGQEGSGAQTGAGAGRAQPAAGSVRSGMSPAEKGAAAANGATEVR